MLKSNGIRDNKRYTQQEMAIGAGLYEGAVSRLMRYDTLDNVPLSHALAVAKWLEVHVKDLVREEATD